jgi:hypothetical protein
MVPRRPHRAESSRSAPTTAPSFWSWRASDDQRSPHLVIGRVAQLGRTTGAPTLPTAPIVGRADRRPSSAATVATTARAQPAMMKPCSGVSAMLAGMTAIPMVPRMTVKLIDINRRRSGFGNSDKRARSAIPIIGVTTPEPALNASIHPRPGAMPVAASRSPATAHARQKRVTNAPDCLFLAATAFPSSAPAPEAASTAP